MSDLVRFRIENVANQNALKVLGAEANALQDEERELRTELAEYQRAVSSIVDSPSWKVASRVAASANKHPKVTLKAVQTGRSLHAKVYRNHFSAPSQPFLTDPRSAALSPLPVYSLPTTRRRINVVTDSISKGSLFGGVGTSLVLAVQLAKELDAELRVVTRTEPPVPDNMTQVLTANGIEFGGNIEFTLCPGGSRQPAIDVTPGDTWLTTSWWTTRAVRSSVRSETIIYLVQEDERRFYPDGDDSMLCTEVFADANLKFVINSSLLYRHFAEDPSIGSMCERSLWFEPAFPRTPPSAPDPWRGDRLDFFFYARPNHPRNLYVLGLEVVNEAIKRNVLDPSRWNVHFVGSNLKSVTLASGVEPTFFQDRSWQEYRSLVQRMDLGLSLMASPHPSYPPLDLAAAGAVVVTNSYGASKRSLDQYSENIIVAEPAKEQLVEGLIRGVDLVNDAQRRRHNWEANTIPDDWPGTLQPVVERLAGEIRRGCVQ